MPPLEPPPTGSSVSSASSTSLADTLYKDGQGNKTTPTPGASSAALDLSTLSTVLKSAIKADQSLVLYSTNIGVSGTAIQYIIGSTQKVTNRAQGALLDDFYLITINVFGSISTSSATATMKAFLNSFDSLGTKAPNVVVQPLKNANAPLLGDCSLGTADTVFWVRGESVFAQVSHRLNGDNVTTPAKANLDNDATLNIAKLLDQHLATSWATDATKQKKPTPALATPVPVKAKVGTIFTVQLNNVLETHEIKGAEDVGSSLVVLTENGTKEGKFTFLPLQPGKTTVRMRVADAKTLAVAEVDAAVEVA